MKCFFFAKRRVLGPDGLHEMLNWGKWLMKTLHQFPFVSLYSSSGRDEIYIQMAKKNNNNINMLPCV